MKLATTTEVVRAEAELDRVRKDLKLAREEHAKAFRNALVRLCNDNGFVIEAERSPHEDLIIRRGNDGMLEENIEIDED